MDRNARLDFIVQTLCEPSDRPTSLRHRVMVSAAAEIGLKAIAYTSKGGDFFTVYGATDEQFERLIRIGNEAEVRCTPAPD